MPAPPITMPFGEFLPDQPDFANPGTNNVINVIPRTKNSYGPLSQLSAFSSALNARCQGAGSFLDGSGNVIMFAGDVSKLYQLGTSTTWTNVSKGGGYACPSDGQWNFTQMGSRVICTDFFDAIQSYTLGGTAVIFADLAAAAPKARYAAVVRNFLMVANTFDGTYGNQNQRAWWSALNDPTNWPTPGSAAAAIVQSSFNDLLGDAGWITGLVGNLGTADGAVFMERAVYRIVYSGPGQVFQFIPAEGVRGTQAPNSIVQLGPIVFYLGRDGFYRFDGSQSVPIGADKIDKTFYRDVDQNNMHRIVGAVDPINKLVMWAYPSLSATNGNPDSLLIYNWLLERWSYAQVTLETLVSGITLGYTLDQMNIFGTFDSMPQFQLDSRVWTGGKDILGAFGITHDLEYFNGAPMAATLDTTEHAPNNDRITNLTNVRPLIDGGSPSINVGVRARLIDQPMFGTAAVINALGTTPQRASGRYLRYRMTVPANNSWEHAQGVQVYGNAAGIR